MRVSLESQVLLEGKYYHEFFGRQDHWLRESLGQTINKKEKY